jgi:RimJ/RimL family protein N-acetyltransferase
MNNIYILDNPDTINEHIEMILYGKTSNKNGYIKVKNNKQVISTAIKELTPQVFDFNEYKKYLERTLISIKTINKINKHTLQQEDYIDQALQRGDSGGPLIITFDTNKIALVGVVSVIGGGLRNIFITAKSLFGKKTFTDLNIPVKYVKIVDDNEIMEITEPSPYIDRPKDFNTEILFTPIDDNKIREELNKTINDYKNDIIKYEGKTEEEALTKATDYFNNLIELSTGKKKVNVYMFTIQHEKTIGGNKEIIDIGKIFCTVNNTILLIDEFSINENYRGQRYGNIALSRFINFIKNQIPSLTNIHLYVFKENIVALKLYTKNRFIIVLKQRYQHKMEYTY